MPRSRTLGKVKKNSFSGKEREEKNKKNLCRVPRSRTLGKVKNIFSRKEREEKNEKKIFAECPDLGHSVK